MKYRRLVLFSLLILLFSGARFQQNAHDFNIRTITAGVSLTSLSDTVSIGKAIVFLKSARETFERKGYIVQTIRLSTQNLHELTGGTPTAQTIQQLKRIDQMARKNGVSLSIGELMAENQYSPTLKDWVAQLVKETTNINFSISISSKKYGIHEKSIQAAAEICRVLSDSKGGEANFRFTASANCPAGIPFFPAAFHTGPNSFAIGLESPRLLTKVFVNSTWENAREDLKAAMNAELKPIEEIAQSLQSASGLQYDGIDTSPAPGLNASIGEAIETLTKKPFGSTTTLSACALITDVLKNLNVKTCGYSGLMLPVIEDKVLARRAIEKRYTVKELLLFSAVSGTGLDVVPIAGDTPIETIEGIYRDVAALSLKYSNKALSARLFPIPGKKAGQPIAFENPYLTASVVMGIE